MAPCPHPTSPYMALRRHETHKTESPIMNDRATMRPGRILIASVCALWLAGPALADDEVVARVNGVEITERDVAMATRELGQTLQNLPQAQHRDYVLAYLTDLQVVAQAAEEAGYAEDSRVANRITYLTNRTLMEFYLEDLATDAATEEEARELYAEVIQRVEPETELHTHHILVETEAEAEELRARIEAGEDFAELAEEHSMDPGSAQQGGDLGYIQPQALVPEFAEVAMALEPGALSEPVETQFGWHILRVEDRREGEPPSYEEVEEELMSLLTRQAQHDALLELREAAEIEIEADDVDPDLAEPDVTPDLVD